MPVVKFLPRAERQLLVLPETLQDEILNKVERLLDFPRMGIAMERAYADYRCLLAGGGRYRIIYRIKSPALIEVAYLRHCRRQLSLRLM